MTIERKEATAPPSVASSLPPINDIDLVEVVEVSVFAFVQPFPPQIQVLPNGNSLLFQAMFAPRMSVFVCMVVVVAVVVTLTRRNLY